MSGTYSLARTSERGLQLAGVDLWPAGLLILGKPQWTMTAFDPLKYSLCLFDSSAAYQMDCIMAGLPAYCNIRVVRGPKGQLHLVNSEQGVLQLSDSSVTQVIGPDKASYASDPRYHRSATVYIGIQGEGRSCFGRPILDVALDAQGYAYVVPVVVQPVGENEYVAAAKLMLDNGKGPSWQLDQLYDDPPAANDNQPRNYLRKIEVDEAGNVYLVNVHDLNESDILWKYSRDGTLLRRWDLVMKDRTTNMPDPIALTVTADGQMLYLASGQYNGPDPNNAMIYGLSAQAKDSSLARSITVENMAIVTSITQDPATNSVWAVGFSTARTPARPGMQGQFVHTPRWVKIPSGNTTVEAVDISDPTGVNMALPMSIVWTRATD